MELFNFQTNQLEALPDDQITDAVRSGTFGFRRGTQVPVVLNDGRKGDIPAEKAFQAFSTGKARLYTQSEQEQDALNASVKTFSGGLLTGAAALARGATLGISDQLLTAGDSPEAMKRKAFLAAGRDQHPASTLALDVIGAIIPSIASFGTAAPVAAGGRAAAALATRKALSYTPAGLVAKAGRAVEGQMARTIAGQSATSAANLSIGRAIAPRAVGSAVEGAAFATGQLVSEQALGDIELTAESVIATAGIGALLGGSIGGALALPGALSTRAMTAAKTKFDKSVQEVRKTAEDFADAAKKKGGPVAEDAKRILSEIDGELLEAARVPNPSSKYFDPTDISPFSSTERAVAMTGDISKEEARRYLKHTTRIKQAPDAPQFLDIVEDALSREGDGIEAAIRRLGSHLDDNIIGNSQSTFNIGDLATRVRQMADREAGAGVTDKSRSAVVKFLRTYEKDLRAKHKIMNKNVSLSDVRSEIKALRARLPARETVGEAAGDQLERAVMDLDQFLSAQIKQDPVIGAEASKILTEMQKLIRTRDSARKMLKTQDPRTILRFLSREFNGEVSPRLDRNGIPNQVQTLADLGPFARHNGQPVNFQEVFKDRILREKLVANGAIAKTSGEEAQTQFLRAIAGTAVGADLIAAAGRVGFIRESIQFGRGKLFEKLTDPADNMFKNVFNRMKSLEDMKMAVEKKIRAGATQFKEAAAGRSAVAVPRITGPAIPGATKIFTEFSLLQDRKERSKDPYEAAMQVSSELADMAANPYGIAERLSNRLEALSDVAPETANEISQTTLRAIQYLNQVSPKNPFEGSLIPTSYTPSDREVQRFASILEAIERPTQMFDDFAVGLLSSEQVDVMQNVYPGMYRYFVDTILDEISGAEGLNMSTEQQISLSLLLGIPVSPLMQGKFILRMQSMNEPSTEAQGQGPQGLTVQGLSKLNKNKSKMSPLERVQAGEIGE